MARDKRALALSRIKRARAVTYKGSMYERGRLITDEFVNGIRAADFDLIIAPLLTDERKLEHGYEI